MARPIHALAALFAAALVLLGYTVFPRSGSAPDRINRPLAPSVDGPDDGRDIHVATPPTATVDSLAGPIANVPPSSSQEPRAEEPASATPPSLVEVQLAETGRTLDGLLVRVEGHGLVREGKTDSAGVFRADLPPGDYRVEIPSRGLVTGLAVSPSGRTEARLELPGAGWLAGTVTDLDSSTPLAGVDVSIYPEGFDGEDAAYHRIGWAVTGSDGRFRIEGLPSARPILVVASARGFDESRETVLPDQAIRIGLAALGGFIVAVVDDAKAPIASSAVEIEITRPRGASESYEAFLDSEGRVFVSELPTGIYEVRLRATDGPWSSPVRAHALVESSPPIVVQVAMIGGAPPPPSNRPPNEEIETQ